MLDSIVQFLCRLSRLIRSEDQPPYDTLVGQTRHVIHNIMSTVESKRLFFSIAQETFICSVSQTKQKLMALFGSMG
jgi:hypothetical protein